MRHVWIVMAKSLVVSAAGAAVAYAVEQLLVGAWGDDPGFIALVIRTAVGGCRRRPRDRGRVPRVADRASSGLSSGSCPTSSAGAAARDRPPLRRRRRRVRRCGPGRRPRLVGRLRRVEPARLVPPAHRLGAGEGGQRLVRPSPPRSRDRDRRRRRGPGAAAPSRRRCRGPSAMPRAGPCSTAGTPRAIARFTGLARAGLRDRRPGEPSADRPGDRARRRPRRRRRRDRRACAGPAGGPRRRSSPSRPASSTSRRTRTPCGATCARSGAST